MSVAVVIPRISWFISHINLDYKHFRFRGRHLFLVSHSGHYFISLLVFINDICWRSIMSLSERRIVLDPMWDDFVYQTLYKSCWLLKLSRKVVGGIFPIGTERAVTIIGTRRHELRCLWYEIHPNTKKIVNIKLPFTDPDERNSDHFDK